MRYIELYGGMGGFRRGIEQAGMNWQCVWYCDINKYVTWVFNKNFQEEYPPQDIREVDVSTIPDHDLLCAGFPCQAFSIAGKRRGFGDARGPLFFEIIRILKEKQPRYFILENVRGLLSHAEGRTFTIMLSMLAKTVNLQTFLHNYEESLGYHVFWKVLNSRDFGVPQNRERVFVVGFKNDLDMEKFEFPRSPRTRSTLSEILEENVSEKYYLSEKMQKRFEEYLKEKKMETPTVSNPIMSGYPRYQNPEDFERKKGQLIYDVFNQSIRKDGIAGALRGQGVSKTSLGTAIYDRKGFDSETKGFRESIDITPTLTQKGGTGGNNVPMIAHNDRGELKFSDFAHCIDKNYWKGPDNHAQRPLTQKDGRLRRLTPMECERLQGFPDDWTKKGMDEEGNVHKISDTQRYKMLGNAVTTNVVEAIVGKFAYHTLIGHVSLKNYGITMGGTS